MRAKRKIPGAFLASAAVGMAPSLAGLSILDRSPFIWPGFETNDGQVSTEPEQTPAESKDFEFHAVYELSGSIQVLLRDRKENKFHWLEVGEESDGYFPKEFDPEKDQLLLAYADGEKWLSLQSLPEVSGTPVATAAASSSPTVRRPTGTASSRSVIRPTRRPGSSTASSARITRPSVTASSSDSARPTPGAPVRRFRGNTDPGVETPRFTPPSVPTTSLSVEPPSSRPTLPAGIRRPPPP
jgi:hypothetical protein